MVTIIERCPKCGEMFCTQHEVDTRDDLRKAIGKVKEQIREHVEVSHGNSATAGTVQR